MDDTETPSEANRTLDEISASRAALENRISTRQMEENEKKAQESAKRDAERYQRDMAERQMVASAQQNMGATLGGFTGGLNAYGTADSTLRFHCLTMAINSSQGSPPDEIIKKAEAFYNFLIGAKTGASLHVVKP